MSKLQLSMSDMLNHFDPDFGLIIDLFAGGGGASEGIRAALGRDPDVAVNHDPEAISMHTVNHHDTMHFTADVFEVDPMMIWPEYPVGLLWASPACTHFSKARGSKPVCKQLRSLAWIVVKWARLRQPKQIYLENVEEFTDWGPVLDDGQPCPIRKGETFTRFVSELQKLGYDVEWREVKAHEYGALTIRKRLFMVARCDGKEIVWPEPTNGDPKSPEVKSGKRKPFRTAPRRDMAERIRTQRRSIPRTAHHHPEKQKPPDECYFGKPYCQRRENGTEAKKEVCASHIPQRVDNGTDQSETIRERPKLQGAEEISPSDFIKPEHYFDALEVQRILNEMRRAG